MMNCSAVGGNDIVYGGGGNDLLGDGSGDDFLWGQAGDDRLRADQGNDWLNGGDGYDTALANDLPLNVFSSYSITKENGAIILTDINGDSDGEDYGRDTLINVEAISFWDGIYVIATGTFTPFDSVV
jgi:Ca2+-binding RTX toxin-like protein